MKHHHFSIAKAYSSASSIMGPPGPTWGHFPIPNPPVASPLASRNWSRASSGKTFEEARPMGPSLGPSLGRSNWAKIDENQRSGWTPGCLEDSWRILGGFLVSFCLFFPHIVESVTSFKCESKKKASKYFQYVERSENYVSHLDLGENPTGRFLNSNHFGQLQSRRPRGRANEQWWRFFLVIEASSGKYLLVIEDGTWKSPI